MSSPSDRAYSSDDPSFYAPKWAREDEPERRVRRALRTVESEPDNVTALVTGQAAESGYVIDRMRIPRSLEPGMIPEPPPLKLRAPFPWGKFSIALALACAAALFAVGAIPSRWIGDALAPADQGKPSTRLSGQAQSQAEPPAPPPAQLAAAEPQPAAAGEAAPLGVSLRHASDGHAVVVSGLPAGATLSAGYPYGAGGWRIPARELGDAVVYPPRGFTGGVELGLELRDPNDAVTERRALRLEWAAAKAAPPAQTQNAAPQAQSAPPPPAPAVRTLDADEIEMLMRRGQEFLATGDISSARLMFKRAAEAHDARAAFALATTYDPLVLERTTVIGVKPDVGMARRWYERAKEYGSVEAPRRLEMLASAGL